MASNFCLIQSRHNSSSGWAVAQQKALACEPSHPSRAISSKNILFRNIPDERLSFLGRTSNEISNAHRIHILHKLLIGISQRIEDGAVHILLDQMNTATARRNHPWRTVQYAGLETNQTNHKEARVLHYASHLAVYIALISFVLLAIAIFDYYDL